MTQQQEYAIRYLPGQVCHTSFWSDQPKAVNTFLCNVFGWSSEAVTQEGGKKYYMLSYANGVPFAGVGTAPEGVKAPLTCSYIQTTNIQKTYQKCQDYDGCEVTSEVTEVPGMGSYFLFNPPGGPTWACWADATEVAKAANKAPTYKGARTALTIVGRPFTSTESKACQSFFKSVFGWSWEPRETPEGKMPFYNDANGDGGVIMKPESGKQPILHNHILVPSAKDYEAKILAAGGSIVHPVTRIEGVGNYFVFSPPNGPELVCWEDISS